ncbi:MAG: hypothetical protein LH614_19410 [Pyrinomonadaceae bacterium]|nr:hypothetical protein [Pyrinomonadaceae bacterium]
MQTEEDLVTPVKILEEEKQLMKLTIFLVIMSLFSGCAQNAPSGNSDILNKVAVRTPQATPTVAVTTPESSGDAAGVTLANFNKLRKGMALEEIKKTIGSEGKVISESETPGYKLAMYQWKSGANNISCMFQNDKMISKTQFGL